MMLGTVIVVRRGSRPSNEVEFVQECRTWSPDTRLTITSRNEVCMFYLSRY